VKFNLSKSHDFLLSKITDTLRLTHYFELSFIIEKERERIMMKK